MKKISIKRFLTMAFPLIAILLASLYLFVRTSLFIVTSLQWSEKLISFLLLFAESFLLIHGIGYFLEIFRVTFRKNEKQYDNFQSELSEYPPVAIIVSAYKEPLDVVEDTLTAFYNLTYPNKNLYFLDDTRYDLPESKTKEMEKYRKDINNLCKTKEINLFRRNWHGAKAGMINDFLDFIHGKNKKGFEFTKNQNKNQNKDKNNDKLEKEKYIIVFDADMNPFPNFVEPLVSAMEKNQKLAFLQTPQYYTNFETNRIARASGLQQAVFYEYICEGKSLQDAMFCCGTNVIFRTKALYGVGGFDESSVTEDFATSLKFHMDGWSSGYYNKVGAFGMGPEDLGGFFKQQFRWALGTVGLLRQLIKYLFIKPSILTTVRWWEYFLSSTYYFIGLVFLILIICPICYIFFNLPSYLANPEIYALFFIPYIVVTLLLFWGSLRNRGYKFKDIILGQLLIAITSPVYLKASILAISGFKGSFGITPKSGSKSLPFSSLWVQILLSLLNFSAIIWGINRIYFEGTAILSLSVNILWCIYHFLILSSIFYFNNPEELKSE